MCQTVNKCRKDLFSRKGRLPEGLSPTLDAPEIHLKRAVYKASFCWAQSLSKDAVLPDPNEWGWKTCNEGYDLVWTTITEASKMCQELICGCKSEKGVCENLPKMYSFV